MAIDHKTITLQELPPLKELKDSDFLITSDGSTTQKINGYDFIQYVKKHSDISGFFVHQDTVGKPEGIAPLDAASKLFSNNIPFGSSAGSVFDGASGKALSDALTSHTADKGNPHRVTKAQVGLGNANDTSDLDKPVSTAQQSAIRKACEDAGKYTDTAISHIVDGAPEDMDTLHKAAKALKGQKKTVEALNSLIGNKVDKAAGKKLSSNDYTDEEKAKLLSIENGANLYVHPDTDGCKHIPANGTANDGSYLKSTSTPGIYAWGTLTKADVESALGYTPSGSESVTYRLNKSGSDIILTGSDGSSTSVTDSDTNYTLSDFGITSSSAEINQLKGVKTNVQTQLSNVYTKSEATTLLNDKLTKAGDGSNLTAAFTEASTLATINTGEKLSVIMGKVKKAITSLLSHITTTATTSVLGHVKVDSALSSTSINPIQNKAISTALAGKLSAAGDASGTTVAYTEAAALSELASGEKLSAAFGKLKLTVKNVISFARLLGSTDISAIGGGTVTGAISALNSNLKADHWLPAPGYDLLEAAPNKAIQIYSANPNILAAQGVPEQFSQYGTYVCYGKCEYPTLMYIDVFGRFGAYGRETKQWENYFALETFDITPVTGVNAGMSLKIKNEILYSKVWVTLPNMSEWSSCAICTVSGWTYGSIELGQIHSVYGVNSSNVNITISTDGIVSAHTHAAVSGGVWFYGSNAICL